VLVGAGLQRLRQGRGQPGLRALIRETGRDEATLTAADIGFGIAPRLNAAGRLEDMALGIDCLLCDEPDRAQEMAAVLNGINVERRDLQQSMVDGAEAALERIPDDAEAVPAAVVLFDPAWHPGVVGLVASRIKDRCHRPTLAFAPAESDSRMLRGSARSIPGLHIRDALARVDARHPGLIERFGGHAMAAGLSLRAEHFDRFREAMIASVESMLAPELLRAELASDGPLAPQDFNRELADRLRMAGPWGQGFPEPVFDNDFEVREWRVLGERHLKLSLALASDSPAISAIQFGGWQGTPPSAKIHAAYQLEPDDYRGRRGVQLLIRHWYHCPSQ
jgi:single-stranded-DNA-specific exonuclease